MRIVGGEDHVAFVDVGDDQIVSAVMVAQRRRVDALAVAHGFIGELGLSVHCVADTPPMLAVGAFEHGQSRKEFEGTVDHVIRTLRGFADGRIRMET